MRMKKGAEFLKRAARDFELARKYKDAREYITASILYRKATEKVLKALFMKHRKQEAPKGASIEFLATHARLPDEMQYELVDMPTESAEMDMEESLQEYDDAEQTDRVGATEYESTLSKHEVVRRLLDYAKANI